MFKRFEVEIQLKFPERIKTCKVWKQNVHLLFLIILKFP